jgi:SAM-dependent methyltransferase
MTVSAYRLATLDRFDQLNQAWSANAALRELYAYWYAEIRAALAPVASGFVIEIGSGPAISKQFLPGIRTSDTVKADWHDYEIDAMQQWPFADATVDGVVLFDVLHHLAAPRVLFQEASRTLRPGGRLVLMEPYVSPLSYPIYRFVHDEGVDLSVRPLALEHAPEKDPFTGNQALPGLIFGRDAAEFRRLFPGLQVVDRRLYSGLSYLASGGYSHRCLLPHSLWSALFWADTHLPAMLQPLAAFRMLLVLERVAR